MFWIIMKFNIRVRVIHIPGGLNQIPDSVLRLHESGQALRLNSLLMNWHHGYSTASFYEQYYLSMSAPSFQAIHPQLPKWFYRLNQSKKLHHTSTSADNTKKSYTSHLKKYFGFCSLIGVPPVPTSQSVLAQYAAYLARDLKPASVCQYMNIMRTLHLEANFKTPLQGI